MRRFPITFNSGCPVLGPEERPDTEGADGYGEADAAGHATSSR
jgi:hypothetical protein